MQPLYQYAKGAPANIYLHSKLGEHGSYDKSKAVVTVRGTKGGRA
jgi:hypothetical protein